MNPDVPESLTSALDSIPHAASDFFGPIVEFCVVIALVFVGIAVLLYLLRVLSRPMFSKSDIEWWESKTGEKWPG